MKKLQLYSKILLNLVIFIGGILCVFLLVPKLIGYFAPFVVGWIIAMIANPLVRFMEKRVKIVRKHSSAIIIILVILAVIGALYGIIYFAFVQVKSLMEDLPNMLVSVQKLFEGASTRLTKVYDMLPVTVQGVIDEGIISIQAALKNILSGDRAAGLGGVAGNMAKSVVEIALMTIVALLSAYFFIKERDNIAVFIKKNSPESVIKNYNLIVDNFRLAFGGYFKAQFKIMVILTGIMFVGFELMRVDYSFLFALLIAMLDFLPFFGTGAVLWPWAVIELFAGNVKRAICIMVIYLVCQIVRQVLQPKMVGDSIGLNPFATLIFMFVGYRLYGGFGLILGIPVGMVIVKFYRLGMFDNMIKGFKLMVHDINEFRKF